MTAQMRFPDIPDHRIERELGSGGMAYVYLATHTTMGNQRAVKVMKQHLAYERGFKENFLNEGQVVARLHHPNIVEIYDMKISGDICYMSMEYLDDGTLKDKLKKQSLSVEESIFILQQVGAGLHHAHRNNYIHRDIKPANILFKRNGTVKLADFGISKLQDVSGDLTLAGFNPGTLIYMGPEQKNGTAIDHRCDIYSLGLVFFEMLTGQRAKDPNTSTQAIFPDCDSPILPPQYQHLQIALNKALAKNPENRYDSVLEFISELISANGRATPPPKSGHGIEDENDKTDPGKPLPPPPSGLGKTLVVLSSLAILLVGGWYVVNNTQLLQSFSDSSDVTKGAPVEQQEAADQLKLDIEKSLQELNLLEEKTTTPFEPN